MLGRYVRCDLNLVRPEPIPANANHDHYRDHETSSRDGRGPRQVSVSGRPLLWRARKSGNLCAEQDVSLGSNSSSGPASSSLSESSSETNRTRSTNRQPSATRRALALQRRPGRTNWLRNARRTITRQQGGEGKYLISSCSRTVDAAETGANPMAADTHRRVCADSADVPDDGELVSRRPGAKGRGMRSGGFRVWPSDRRRVRWHCVGAVSCREGSDESALRPPRGR